MSNPGNAGHRYKMVVLKDALIENGRILHILACGHRHTSPLYSSETLATVRSYIGTKERCYKCAEKERGEA